MVTNAFSFISETALVTAFCSQSSALYFTIFGLLIDMCRQHSQRVVLNAVTSKDVFLVFVESCYYI